MSSAATLPAHAADALAADGSLVPVDPGGLLARIERPCPQHGGEAGCVARSEEADCLVYWCARAEHHFSVR